MRIIEIQGIQFEFDIPENYFIYNTCRGIKRNKAYVYASETRNGVYFRYYSNNECENIDNQIDADLRRDLVNDDLMYDDADYDRAEASFENRNNC